MAQKEQEHAAKVGKMQSQHEQEMAEAKRVESELRDEIEKLKAKI